jgi:nicotinamide riboside transporter PnuC
MIAMDSVTIYYATWLLAVVSLVGTYLNIKKQKMCFVIWGVTNALWVLYDFSIGAIAQAALMLCYFVLAVHGFYEWKKGTTTSYITHL